MKLRQYQIDAVAGVQQKFREGKKSVLLVSHMGTGKTVIASDMISKAVKNKKRVLFIAHRTFLITQCRDKLLKFGITAGLIKAGFKEDRSQQVQIASIQTLKNRNLPPADLIIVDEGHHATAEEYKKILKIFIDNGAFICGLTATPFLLSRRKGLNEVYQDFVSTISVAEHIKQGNVLDSKVFYAKSQMDLTKMSITNGDFDAKEAFAAFDTTNVYVNLIDKYHTHIGRKKTIVFCINKEHCIKVTQALNEAGYRGAYVIAETPEEERLLHLSRLESGEYDFMANVDVYTEGFDMPTLEAAVLCYRTMSKTKLFQSAARPGRPLPEDEGMPMEQKKKPYYTILDMADNIKRLLPIEWPFEISLEPRGSKDKEGVAPIKDCPNCGYMMPVQMRACPECSTEMPPNPKTKKEIQEEEFAELDKQRLKLIPYLGLPANRHNEIPSELLEAFAKEKGYKKGWVNHILVARGEKRKPIKIIGYDFPDYFKQKGILEKAYYDKTYPIDAHTWQFIGEDNKNIIYEYKLNENKEPIL